MLWFLGKLGFAGGKFVEFGGVCVEVGAKPGAAALEHLGEGFDRMFLDAAIGQK